MGTSWLHSYAITGRYTSLKSTATVANWLQIRSVAALSVPHVPSGSSPRRQSASKCHLQPLNPTMALRPTPGTSPNISVQQHTWMTPFIAACRALFRCIMCLHLSVGCSCDLAVLQSIILFLQWSTARKSQMCCIKWCSTCTQA